MRAEGWYKDPFEVHRQRWYSNGRPTSLVRDDGVESHDPPPADISVTPTPVAVHEEPAPPFATMGQNIVLDATGHWSPPARSFREMAKPSLWALALSVLGGAIALVIAYLAGSSHPWVAAGITTGVCALLGFVQVSGGEYRDMRAARKADWSEDLYPR